MVKRKTDNLKIAVIGCGNFAHSFVRLFQRHPAVSEVYVCDSIAERAAEFAEKYGVKVLNSFDDALDNQHIHAVALFTPRQMHASMAIRALQAGKHVYSSTPCALSIEEICEIEQLVRKTGLIYSMGETGFYRSATIFCRNAYFSGKFGRFVYGEAQYNHDIRNQMNSFRHSSGDAWKKYAGLPPMFYPTHSTSMILGAMLGIYAKKVVAFGYHEQDRTDIFGDGDVNVYGNPFSNTSMMMELSNNGIVRISENRSVAWKSPHTYISQFYGTNACYEFSVTHHYFSQWKAEAPDEIRMADVSEQLVPPAIWSDLQNNPSKTLQEISDGRGYTDSAPIQPIDRVPKSFYDVPNAHNGTHYFMADDFCRAVATGKLPPTNIWQTARYNIPGLIAHQSALAGGQTMDVPDLGDPPADWELLNPDHFPRP